VRATQYFYEGLVIATSDDDELHDASIVQRLHDTSHERPSIGRQ